VIAFWSLNPFWTSSEPFESGVARITLRKDGKPLPVPPTLKRQVFISLPSKQRWDPGGYVNMTISSNQTSVFPILQEPSYSTVFLYLYVEASGNNSTPIAKDLNGTVTFHLFKGNSTEAEQFLTEEGAKLLPSPVWVYNFR